MRATCGFVVERQTQKASLRSSAFAGHPGGLVAHPPRQPAQHVAPCADMWQSKRRRGRESTSSRALGGLDTLTHTVPRGTALCHSGRRAREACAGAHAHAPAARPPGAGTRGSEPSSEQAAAGALAHSHSLTCRAEALTAPRLTRGARAPTPPQLLALYKCPGYLAQTLTRSRRSQTCPSRDAPGPPLLPLKRPMVVGRRARGLLYT